MINLKLIEQEIDELLATETTESLQSWFRTYCSKSLSNYLGEGQLCDLIQEETIILDGATQTLILPPDSDFEDIDLRQYAMAA